MYYVFGLLLPHAIDIVIAATMVKVIAMDIVNRKLYCCRDGDVVAIEIAVAAHLFVMYLLPPLAWLLSF